MSADSRLNRAFEYAPSLPLLEHSRFVLFSDCHRGTGTSGDNFLKNQHLYFAALQYYLERNFTYIELGDGDELWENRRMGQIIEIHSNVFWLLSLFHRQNRLYMVYGNHDMAKKKKSYGKAFCSSYFCTDTQSYQPLFPHVTFHEGIILESAREDYRLYLTHGHQADIMNSTFWKLTRFLVRYFWKPLEHFGVLDPTSAAKNYTCKDRIERRLSDYAQSQRMPLIVGHTHRPHLDPAAPYYMNAGSCVHPSCITCLEIEKGKITLVKWTLSVKKDRTLYVAREILSESILNPLFPGP